MERFHERFFVAGKVHVAKQGGSKRPVTVAEGPEVDAHEPADDANLQGTARVRHKRSRRDTKQEEKREKRNTSRGSRWNLPPLHCRSTDEKKKTRNPRG